MQLSGKNKPKFHVLCYFSFFYLKVCTEEKTNNKNIRFK